MAAHVHSSHVHMYAPEDSLSCRLEATRMILSKGVICRPDKRQRHQAKKLCVVRNDSRDGVIFTQRQNFTAVFRYHNSMLVLSR
ncbi:hypothetical protein DNU24_01695 [Salmonella enterica subsp. salamae]|uniref:Uncharacterized protein n=1 Tax=Salmonella enterica subsp. salamae TaxID=59202 RepID=A0A5Y3X407_SALER|nr:hypothetical protein [Salmonella enterica subsp. salamae]MJK45844.1 hypothetical protein [Salmonella enterica subsp. salamae]